MLEDNLLKGGGRRGDLREVSNHGHAYFQESPFELLAVKIQRLDGSLSAGEFDVGESLGTAPELVTRNGHLKGKDVTDTCAKTYLDPDLLG